MEKYAFHFPEITESRYRSNSTSFANVPTPTSVHHLVHLS
jgi:hypothetical protein